MMDDKNKKKDKADNTDDKFDQIFDDNFEDSRDKDKKDKDSDEVLILDDSFEPVEEDEFAGDLFAGDGDATAISEISRKKDEARKTQKVSESGIDIYKVDGEPGPDQKKEDGVEIHGDELEEKGSEIRGSEVDEFEEEEYRGVKEEVIELDFPNESSEADFKDLEGLFEEESQELDQAKGDTHDLLQHKKVKETEQPVEEEPVVLEDNGEFVQEDLTGSTEELEFSRDSSDEEIEQSGDEIPLVIEDASYQGTPEGPTAPKSEGSLDPPEEVEELGEPAEDKKEDDLGGFIVEDHRSFEEDKPLKPEKKILDIESKGDIEDLVREKRPEVPVELPEEEVNINNLEPEKRVSEPPVRQERKSFRLDDDEPKKSFLNLIESLIEKLKIPGIIAGIIAIIAIVYFFMISSSDAIY
jgi:hypothetical protein